MPVNENYASTLSKIEKYLENKLNRYNSAVPCVERFFDTVPLSILYFVPYATIYTLSAL